MNDKIKKLAKLVVDKSLEVKESDNVLIMMESLEPKPLVKEIIRNINEKKAVCVVKIKDPELDSLLMEKTGDRRIGILKDINALEVKKFDCFINIKCNQNDFMDHLVDNNINNLLSKELEKDNDIKINKRRWVLLNYPSNVDAFKAKMNNDEFFDYSMDAMNYNFSNIKEGVSEVKRMMEETDVVKIVSPDTNISFSIKDMNSVSCLGNMNLPDGEIYTAPIKNSVNGYITYNTPSSYRGAIFNNIHFEFKNGRIVDAKCDDAKLSAYLNGILDTDDGARYIGEFAIGLNPLIKNPMGDILFDEKILGSIHLTPGRCYDDASNKNKSNIHWDLVLNMNINYGGGSLYFDDKLIQENGMFIPEELKVLNRNEN